MRKRDRRSAMGDAAWRVAIAALAVLEAGAAPVGPAKDVLDQAHVAAGHVWYDTYCKSCHGEGGGPGTAVYRGRARR